MLALLALASLVAAVPHPSPKPQPLVQPLVQRELSIAPSLTIGSDSPSATQTGIQKNPNVTSSFQQEVRGAVDNVDLMQVFWDAGPDYWKFDFNPAVSLSRAG